ncbi:hypothetical protein FB451DRAFT_1216043 [Mycena latifolia]|nr:hypothetical protein FB451DRAFT_1216043 [Mycena latifolia]
MARRAPSYARNLLLLSSLSAETTLNIYTLSFRDGHSFSSASHPESIPHAPLLVTAQCNAVCPLRCNVPCA